VVVAVLRPHAAQQAHHALAVVLVDKRALGIALEDAKGCLVVAAPLNHPQLVAVRAAQRRPRRDACAQRVRQRRVTREEAGVAPEDRCAVLALPELRVVHQAARRGVLLRHVLTHSATTTRLERRAGLAN